MRRGIGSRLVVLTLLVSSIITLSSTALQLYVDYNRDRGAIDDRLAEIRTSQARALEDSLWETDTEHIRVLLRGLGRLPDIEYVAVTEGGRVVASVGSRRSDDVVTLKEPLVRKYKDAVIELGTLEATASLDAVYARLRDKVLLILGTQAVKTFLVTTFMLLLFQYLVTRNLVSLGEYARNLRIDQVGETVALPRGARGDRPPDELDDLVDALNTMRDNLWKSYSALAHHKAGLERTVAERTKDLVRANEALSGEVEQRREAELHLAQHARDLEQVNRQLRQFASVVSHDLKSPARTITSFGELIRSSGSLHGEDAKYLDFIIRGGDRMRALIEGLLSLAKLNSQVVTRARADLREIAQAAVDDLSAQIEEAGATVSIEALPEIFGDPVQLRQLIQNLVANALKFRRTDRPARVRILAETVAADAIDDPRLAPASTYCRLVIEDNGIGFAPSAAERIFTVFGRLHTEAEYDGIGIGLPTCQRIAERHGGVIDAIGRPSEGATFIVLLPIIREVKRTPSSPAGGPTAPPPA